MAFCCHFEGAFSGGFLHKLSNMYVSRAILTEPLQDFKQPEANMGIPLRNLSICKKSGKSSVKID